MTRKRKTTRRIILGYLCEMYEVGDEFTVKEAVDKLFSYNPNKAKNIPRSYTGNFIPSRVALGTWLKRDERFYKFSYDEMMNSSNNIKQQIWRRIE
tara:strand:+ start:381 stop:668 length:288 start_codon:yes stop_codon:yes gene_type:complete